MQRRRLGDIEVSLLGLGTGRLASLGSGTDKNQAARLLDTATELGINLIDTADTYGSSDCERLLGELLARRKGRFVVVTKGGWVFADLPGPLRKLNQFAKKARQVTGSKQNFHPDYIARAIDASLQRLRVDAIDVYLLHSVTPGAARDEALLDVLRNAKQAGKILSFGLSVDDNALYSAAAAAKGCSAVQSMVNPSTAQSHRDRCASLESAGIGVIANQVFAAGGLLGASDAAAAALDRRAAERGLSRSAALLRFAAAQPAVASVLVGTTNPEHLRTNAAALEPALTDQDGAL